MHSKDNVGRSGTNNHSNQISLNVLLSFAGDLHQMGNAFAKVSEASGWLENGKAEVQFCSTENVDAPLDIMIPHKLMPMVKHLGVEKMGRIREGPVTIEWPGNTVQVILLCSLEILFQVIWVNVNALQLSQCEHLHLRRVLKVITKVFIHCSCDWRGLPPNHHKHAHFRGIDHIGHKRCVAQPQVTQWIAHHNAKVHSLLQRFECDVETFMEKTIGKHTTHVFAFVNELQD